MRKIAVAAPRVPQPSAPQGSNEAIFYSDKGAVVTLARVIIGAQTFALGNISSVASVRVKPPWGWKVMMFFVAAIFFTIGLFPVGYAAVLIAVLGFILARSKYYVVLSASGGEVRALGTTDRARVVAIVAAINEAIVARSSLDHAAYFHRRG